MSSATHTLWFSRAPGLPAGSHVVSLSPSGTFVLQVCLREGLWSPQACNEFYRLSQRETCASVVSKRFPNGPILFYAYNPGIDCDRKLLVFWSRWSASVCY